MKIYGINCISSSWDGCNGCSTSEHLVDRLFFSTKEKAIENLLEDSFGPGHSTTYKIVEIELDAYITKPEYRKYK